MKTYFTVIGGLILVFTGAFSSAADLLILRDGDRFTGTLENIAGGMVTFRTRLAGRMYVSTGEVAEINTTNSVLLSVAGDESLPGRLITEGGKHYVVNTEQDFRREVALQNISSLTRLPASPMDVVNGEGGRSARVRAGYVFREGTEDYQGPTVQLEATQRLDGGTLSGGFEAEYTGEDPQLDRFFNADLRYLIGNRTWQPEIAAEVERNRDKALDWRGELVLTLRRDIFSDDAQSLELGTGAGVAYEEYDPDPLRDDQGRGILPATGERSVHDADLNLHLDLQYQRQLSRRSDLFSELWVRPSLTDVGDVRAGWNTVLGIPLTPRLRLNLDLRLDYEDGQPYRDLDNWRSAVGANVEVKF